MLDRSMLEYQLDTITNRNQETDFERFARRLAEREICPNLLPQTGPTGGGDSKVDTETYPVADDLSLIWYTGIGREASSERWAFAFSAKKDWRSKVQSDVAKIAATRRGYAKAFFVTSQYVPDKTRAEIEDTLREKHGLDVRILDRSWLLDRVFSGRHEALAIEELDLKTSTRTQVRKGPLDLQRERDLEETEARISATSQQGHFHFLFVDDCIEAAILARGLDRPRAEIDGLFARAQRAAEEYGTRHQRLIRTYQAAWTAYWWHEDYQLFSNLYAEAERHATGSQNAYDLELLTNLWTILSTLVRRGELDEAEVKYQERTATLSAELERSSEQQDRPSSALHARTLRLQMRLLASAPNNLDPVLRDLQDVVRGCEGLVGFPLEPLVRLLIELGDLLGDVPAYGELFETVVEVTSSRQGETAAARMLLKRGAQQLDADRPYEAIRNLGRALGRLYKHESRHDLVHALYLCSCAYERAGLLWAARGTALTAASLATDEFQTYADVTPHQAACYNRLKWLELQLGRVPQTLAWHDVDSLLRRILADQGYNTARLARGETDFDALLGILFLKTDLWELKHLSRIPDVLENLGLDLSAIGLLFALGHKKGLPQGLPGKKGNGEELYDFFAKWRDQPAAKELPATPSLYEQRTVSLRSQVLGCQITVESENAAPCVELAEWLLAALESLLSTSLLKPLVAREPFLTARVRKSDFAEAPFGFELQDRDGRPHVEVRCAVVDPHSMSPETQGQFKDRMLELLVHILARVFLIADPEQVITKLFGDERALDRSIHFTSSLITLGNVLGDSPKTTISAWSDPDACDYPVVRTEEWDAANRRANSEASAATERPKPTFGTGEPPAGLFDASRIKHTQVETTSLMRGALWDQAGWSGTAFLLSADGREPPVLAPIFKNREAAEQIFTQWRRDLGGIDSEERLRVAIIRGIRRNNPNAYRVAIGVNPATAFSRSDIKYVIMMFRLNTMEPTSNRNLKGFLAAYKAHGMYVLAHAVSSDLANVVPILDNHIVKRELHVREAWEIGRHDVDAVGITEDDDPIIPSDLEDVPVLALLRWKRDRTST